jgi:hypothetical protein
MSEINIMHASRDCDVAVITFQETFQGDAEWTYYETAYRKMYTHHKRLIMVFDARAISVPPTDLIMRKMNMTQSLKHLTCIQIAGTIVITKYDVIRVLVNAIVKAGGQASPFHITTDIEEGANCVQDILLASNGCHLENGTHTLRMNQVDKATLMCLAILKFIPSMRHFLRAHLLK